MFRQKWRCKNSWNYNVPKFVNYIYPGIWTAKNDIAKTRETAMSSTNKICCRDQGKARRRNRKWAFRKLENRQITIASRDFWCNSFVFPNNMYIGNDLKILTLIYYLLLGKFFFCFLKSDALKFVPNIMCPCAFIMTFWAIFYFIIWKFWCVRKDDSNFKLRRCKKKG